MSETGTKSAVKRRPPLPSRSVGLSTPASGSYVGLGVGLCEDFVDGLGRDVRALDGFAREYTDVLRAAGLGGEAAGVVGDLEDVQAALLKVSKLISVAVEKSKAWTWKPVVAGPDVRLAASSKSSASRMSAVAYSKTVDDAVGILVSGGDVLKVARLRAKVVGAGRGGGRFDDDVAKRVRAVVASAVDYRLDEASRMLTSPRKRSLFLEEGSAEWAFAGLVEKVNFGVEQVAQMSLDYAASVSKTFAMCTYEQVQRMDGVPLWYMGWRGYVAMSDDQRKVVGNRWEVMAESVLWLRAKAGDPEAIAAEKEQQYGTKRFLLGMTGPLGLGVELGEAAFGVDVISGEKLSRGERLWRSVPTALLFGATGVSLLVKANKAASAMKTAGELEATAVAKGWEVNDTPKPTTPPSEGTGGSVQHSAVNPTELGPSIPKGFGSAADFADFGEHLNSGLVKAGYGDTQALFQGSSVTDMSFKTGAPFGAASDFDVALAGDGVFSAVQSKGISLREGGIRTGPLTAAQVRQLGLSALQTELSTAAGRLVNFMVYGSAADAAARRASIAVPR